MVRDATAFIHRTADTDIFVDHLRGAHEQGRAALLDGLGIAPAAVGTIAPGFLGGTDGRRRFEPLRATARRPAR